MVNKLIFLSPLTTLIFSYFHLYYYILFCKILKNIPFYMPLRQSFMPQIRKFSSLLLYRHTKKPPAGMETFLVKNIYQKGRVTINTSII